MQKTLKNYRIGLTAKVDGRMQMRLLGRTGLRVSTLAFGTMTFGVNPWGSGGLGQAEADRLVAMAIEGGINLFDSADSYAEGESERLLGRALRGRRSQVLLATKVRERVGDGSNDAGLSRGHILDAVDRSLKRLGTDYIDLYQVHGWDARTPIAQTMRALDDLVRSGRVRYIGLSNFAAWQMARSLWVSDSDRLARFESGQYHYSLLCRDVEHEIVPLMADQSLSMLVWSPLSGGFLSGKYSREGQAAPGARYAEVGENWFPPFERELGFHVVERLREVAAEYQATPAQVAMAWLLDRPAVASVIVGVRRPEQLAENLKAAELRLSPETLAGLEELTRPRDQYPGWMIRNQNQD